MILEEFYLSDEGNLKKAVEVTGLDEDEILEIVGGYFTNRSKRWAGKPKDKVTISENYVFLKQSFGGKTLWKAENLEYEELWL